MPDRDGLGEDSADRSALLESFASNLSVDFGRDPYVNLSIKSTRHIPIYHGISSDAGFRVASVHLPQGIADFSHSCIDADGVNDVRHGVRGGDAAV